MGACTVTVVVEATPWDHALMRGAFEVEVTSFPKPYPVAYLYALAATGVMLVALGGTGRVVGYAAAMIRRGGLCHVASIAVHPECRGFGVGSQLLQSLEEACCCWRRACTAILEAKEPRLTRFYGSHGYRVVAFLPDYYGPGGNAILMAKPLECTSGAQCP